MQNQFVFQLIDGRFRSEEVQPLLKTLTQAKLQYHSGKLDDCEGCAEDLKASETRMKQLEASLREALHFLQDVARRGGTVDVEGTLLLTEVAPVRQPEPATA